MNRYFQSLLEQFQTLHQDIRAAIDGLPPEALDWEPGPDMNSINVLVVHLTGSERYWIGDVVMGEDSRRNRDAEFEARGLTAEQLYQRLRAVEEYTQGAFARLKLEDLEADRTSPRNGKTAPAGWCLNHALEHSALHLGHIQIMRQLWLQR